MLVNIQIGFMIKQPIDHVVRFMRRAGDDFGAIGDLLLTLGVNDSPTRISR